MGKITIEDTVAQTETGLAQNCVAGHIGQLRVIINNSKPDTSHVNNPDEPHLSKSYITGM